MNKLIKILAIIFPNNAYFRYLLFRKYLEKYGIKNNIKFKNLNKNRINFKFWCVTIKDITDNYVVREAHWKHICSFIDTL